jgi:hypothetical protein
LGSRSIIQLPDVKKIHQKMTFSITDTLPSADIVDTPHQDNCHNRNHE